MKKTTYFLTIIAVVLCSTITWAQSTIKGTVVDSEMQTPLPGANIKEKGTSKGASTDFDGHFTLTTQNNSGQVVVSFVGYAPVTVNFNGNANLGTISLSPDNTLEEIVITGTGVIDLAEDRKTPVAVSTIKAAEIQEKAANWDLPEVLKSTPSVQNVKAGGFGDGQMYLRGFDQSNTAFLLNGQPINGVEDGKMYWSNWSGVLDIANAIQVQRGLGASKLAISSVGGTVNIVTKTLDAKEGGFVQQLVGNDNYTKTSAYYSTGLNEKGWSFAAMLGHWQGDGYVNYTAGQGQTYFLSVGYKPNDNHALNFLVTGAPQWHAAAGSGSIQSFLDNGRRYNSWTEDPGDSKNTVSGPEGERYPGGRNIYHKPVANVSWDWTINDASSLSTVLYGSLGRGAFAQEKISDGNGYVRGSYNSHNWYGLVSNYNNELTENLNLNLGADVRFYNGLHFRGVNEFVGNMTSLDNTSVYSGSYTITDTYGGINPWGMVFNPNNDHDQRLGYDYEENITYYGLFGQLEYATDTFSAFFQGAASNQDHLKTDYYNYTTAEESDKVSNFGFNVKAGAAYNINENNRVFVNGGYYSRQPFHDNLFVSVRNSNELLPNIDNEEITGFEAGYQFKSEKVSANLNVYHTTWDNRTVTGDNDKNYGPEYIAYSTSGVTQVHMGAELEVFTKPIDKLNLNGYLSLGDWQYEGTGTERQYDQDGVLLETNEIDFDGFKVGGAAQVTGGINANYEILPRFTTDVAWNWYNDQYSTGSLSQEGIAMPSYDTVDFGLGYKMLVGKDDANSVQLRFNLNNVFDEVYLESVTNAEKPSDLTGVSYKGVDTGNTGRFGYGRTWNFSIRFNF